MRGGIYVHCVSKIATPTLQGGSRDMTDIGQHLRAARTAQRMTGEEVAKKVGMSAAAYRRYERNEVEPSISRVMKLAALYKCSVDVLVGIQTPQPQPGRQIDFELREGEKFSIEIGISGVVGK